MKTYKHSGATGDLIYSLPIVKHTGGGEFYLHLNQMDWIGQHYYGAAPNPFHQGRMTLDDYDYMTDFMLAQPYVTRFKVMEAGVEITHNLDRFRPLFVGHPCNYLELYAKVHNVPDDLMYTPWITVPRPRVIEGRPVVINRTQRWIPPVPGIMWGQLKSQGYEGRSMFVGLPEEYEAFCRDTGWEIPYYATETMLELAEVIAGSETFIGNQSQAYALAVGLGHPDIICEARLDMPLERNECYFPKFRNIRYVYKKP